MEKREDSSSELDAWFEAARSGDAVSLRAMASAGFDVEARDPRSGMTALQAAADCSRERCVAALLALGADPEAAAGIGSLLGKAVWLAASATSGSGGWLGETSCGALSLLLSAGCDIEGRARPWGAIEDLASEEGRALISQERARRAALEEAREIGGAVAGERPACRARAL